MSLQVMDEEPKYFLAADAAEVLAAAGSTIRTPNAVRAAVAEGRLHPSGKSGRGVSVWDLPAMREDVEKQRRLMYLNRLHGLQRRLAPRREPVQVALRLPTSEEE